MDAKDHHWSMPTYQRMRSMRKKKGMKRPAQNLLSKRAQPLTQLQKVMINMEKNCSRKESQSQKEKQSDKKEWRGGRAASRLSRCRKRLKKWTPSCSRTTLLSRPSPLPKGSMLKREYYTISIGSSMLIGWRSWRQAGTNNENISNYVKMNILRQSQFHYLPSDSSDETPQINFNR